mgnify:CR=1 FL=1
MGQMTLSQFPWDSPRHKGTRVLAVPVLIYTINLIIQVKERRGSLQDAVNKILKLMGNHFLRSSPHSSLSNEINN